MDKLLDYVLWMRDFPIDATGFRDADALVLCALSYCDFSPLFLTAEEPPLSRCADEGFLENLRVLVTGSGDGFRALLQAAASSRRYGCMRLSEYDDVLREDPPLQFSAVCFHDESELSFMAFRGTDSSLAGWKEDFMIAFTKTEAQELALRYLSAHLVPGRKWIVGGHSKGGNLALYAAAMADDIYLARLQKLYLLDGPGLCPEVLNALRVARVDEKTVRIIPRFSVVGKLFEPAVTDSRIVRSDASGFAQHLLLTWGIDHGEPAYAEENDPTSVWINDTMNAWIDGMTQEERVALVDDLFASLAASGASSLNELVAGGPAAFADVMKRLGESDESTRQSFTDLRKTAFRAALQSVKDRIDALEAKHLAVKAAAEEAKAVEEAKAAEEAREAGETDGPMP